MIPMPVRHVLHCILAGLLAAAVSAPVASQAVVPPKDCGRMTLAGKRYQVKVDQISCASGRKKAKAYVERGARPAGYRCKRYASKVDRVRFYCNDGRKIFFAIRR